jgi:hypothetical protein
MRAMNSIRDPAKPFYWALTGLITLISLYVGVYYELSLWLQLIPIAVAMLGALMVDRSWRGVAIVLGVTLLMYITYCLRHYGPF